MPRDTKQSNGQPLTPFAQRLVRLMDERGVSQVKVGDAIGVQRQTVSLYGLGQSRPDVEALAKIAQFFGVTSDYLLGLTECPSVDLDMRNAVDITGLSIEAVGALELMRVHERKADLRRISRLIETWDEEVIS